MSIDIVVSCITSLLISIGSIMLIRYGNGRESLTNKINSTLQKNLGIEKEERLFQGTHYNMTLYKYNQIRLYTAIAIGVIGIVTVNRSLIIMSIVTFFIFYPKEKVLKIHLPFGLIYKYCRKKDKVMKDDELLEVLSLLKNMMVQLRNNPKGADYIIDYLSGTTDLTKPAFYKFLNLIRLGKIENAEKTFVEELNTSLAADTARILINLDNVEPIILEQSIISIQNEIRQIKTTHKQTRNELYSDLILIPIILTIVFEFVNFLIVAYIGELSSLSYFFNM